MLSTEEIRNLVNMKKYIQWKVKIKDKNKGSHLSASFILFSQDKNYMFEVFMRQNNHIPESFSIGIKIKTDEWSIGLFRYNWAHWEHRNKIWNEKINWAHIHSYDSDYINAGMEYDSYAEETIEYVSFQEAQLKFFEDMNIENYRDHFEEIATMKDSLFN